MKRGERPVYWSKRVPRICQVCLNPLDDEFYDGKTKDGWLVNMCPRCNDRLGTRANQRYTRQADGRYMRT